MLRKLGGKEKLKEEGEKRVRSATKGEKRGKILKTKSWKTWKEDLVKG